MSGEFSAVAAPSPSVNSLAFAAALQKAREIAAKINPSNVGGTPEPQKRSLEDKTGEPEVKKAAVGGGGYAASIADPYSASDPTSIVAQAAAVAARVAAAQAQGAPPGSGPISSKDIKVPDKMVGLIIGRGGEQITRLQAESGCKIQMAPDSGGMSDRMCTLTGNPHNIAKAEDLISQIVNSRSREIPSGPSSANGGYSGAPLGNSGPSMPNMASRMGDSGSSGLPPTVSTIQTPTFTQVEIMVPGPKVGLIIGKGGETIKHLQEKSGAKMVIIQDGPSQENEKPLRITGEPQKVEHAKTLVYEFMAEKDQQMQKQRGGRGGGGGGGGGGGSSGGGGGGSGGYSNSRNSNSQGWDPDLMEATIAVPAGKCGVIIGKGGETIRMLNQQTGAHCEIDRKQQGNLQEKIFIIRGTMEQIENVQRLFSEKLNMNLSLGHISGGSSQNSGYGGGGTSSNGHPSSGGSNMGQGGGGSTSSYNGGNAWPNASSYQQAWQNNPSQNAQSQHPAATSSNNNAAVQMNPSTGQPDYSAQWVEYYRSMGMLKEAAVIEEQAKANKPGGQALTQNMQAQGQLQMNQSQQMAMGMAQQQPQQQQQQVPSAVPAQQQGQGDGTQPDYSAQWAQYYRSVGKMKEAELIEAQMKNKGPMTAAQQPVAQVGAQTAPTPATPGAVPSMYNQQAAAMYGLGGFPQASAAATGGYYATPTHTTANAAAAQYPYNYGYQQPGGDTQHQ